MLKAVGEMANWKGSASVDGRARGVAVVESFNSFVAQIAEVSIGPEGEPKVHKVWCAVDCGVAVNPDVIRAQMEGGIGFGLFLDEVGKFVTKNNDYFYGPSAEIMYILVCLILVGARLIRVIRPLSARESLASATAIAADGVARGLADHHREVGLRLVEQARAGGAPAADVDNVRSLLLSADRASDRLYRLQQWAQTRAHGSPPASGVPPTTQEEQDG